MYIIIKYVKNNKDVEMPVLVINSQNEIWEFDTEEDATKIKTILEKNSVNGYKYIVKGIGLQK